MRRFRLPAACIALAFAAGIAGPSLPGSAAATGPAQQSTLLDVHFAGGFAGDTYNPAPGEVVAGTLTRNTGGETVTAGTVTLPGGSAGLRFAPSAALTSGDAVTSNVVVEALVRRAAGNAGFATLFSLAGGAYYRFRNGSSFVNEFGMNGPNPPYPTVTGDARLPSDTAFDHVALVYSYAGPDRSTLAAYVDGCQTFHTLVNTAPAQAAADAVGIGDEVHPGATDRGFAGALGAVAVSTFTGPFDQGDFRLHGPRAPSGPGTPGQIIPVSACDSAQQVVDKAAHVVPSPRQLAWQKEELTGFVHFGPNTFTGREIGTGTEPVTTFAPTHVDTDQWARTFADAGFKKVILVAKHHDGFVLWPSRYTTYSVKYDTAWLSGHGDLVRQFVDSMHKYGLKVGLYLSPADLHESQPGGRYADGSPFVPTTIPTLVPGDDRAAAVSSGKLPTFHFVSDDYNRYYENTLYELLTQYGRIDEVWFDGYNPEPGVQEHFNYPDWMTLVRKLQPTAAIFGGPDVRWVGNEDGVARESEWSPIPMYGHSQPASLPEMRSDVPDPGGTDRLTNAVNYLSWYPAECDARIESTWFWHPSQPPKSLADLMDMYHTSVGRNCQLLLDVPPDQTGSFDAADTLRMGEFGQRIRATFGTDPAAGSAAAASTESAGHAAANVSDGDPSTYWQARPGQTTGDVTITLPRPTVVSEIVLQEAITAGQRVSSFEVDADTGGTWKSVATGTTIGYKRILPLSDPVTASQLRLRITGARATPAIATFGISSYCPPQVAVSPASPIAQPGQQVGVDVAVTNRCGSTLTGAGLTLTASGGWQLAPATAQLGTLTPGQTVTTHATVTAGQGTSTISATVDYATAAGSDTTTGSGTISVPYADLAAAFGNIGITDDTNTNAGDVDGSQSSYSAQALASAGVTPGAAVSHNGVTFTWPDVPAGQPDNVLAGGQAIAASGSGSTLAFLVTSTYGASSGTGTVIYADGSQQTFTLAAPDWYGTAPAGSDPAITAPYRNRPGNTQDHTPVNIFYRAVSLDPAKSVAAVVLPNVSAGLQAGTPAMHVFAMTIH